MCQLLNIHVQLINVNILNLKTMSEIYVQERGDEVNPVIF